MAELVDYGRLADEYYDEARHPTCAAFRRLSLDYLRRRLALLGNKGSIDSVLEVGAGRSALAELRREGILRADRLTISDAAEEMLAASADLMSAVDEARVLDVKAPRAAEVLGQRFNLIAAVLADPYDDDAFWGFLAASLAAGGLVLITTPAFEWAERFRSAAADEQVGLARFETKSGPVYVPSEVRPSVDEIALMRRHGFQATDVSPIQARAVDEEAAPKLMATISAGSPVVMGYEAILKHS